MPISADRLESFLADVQIPPLPQVVQMLIEVANDPKASATDVAAVVHNDPALSARLLKVANSSFFGQSRRVTTVDRATVVLGIDYIKAIGLAVQLSEPFKALDARGLDMQAFWRNSLLRACIARQLATLADLPVPEHAFLAGLTQDLFIPALVVRHGAAYVQTCNKFRSCQVDLDRWEQRILGYTHAEIGAAVLDLWNLPPILTVPIGGHHGAPLPEPDDSADGEVLAQFAVLARFIGALPLGDGELCTDVELQQSTLSDLESKLGISVEQIPETLRFAKNEFDTIRSLFDEFLPERCEVDVVLHDMCTRMHGMEAMVEHVVFS